MTTRDIFQRELAGEVISLSDPEYPKDPTARHSTYCAPIAIKKGAWLGAAVSVMPGVTIGENAVVAANAVVTRDVPDNAVVGGVPAHVIEHFDLTRSDASRPVHCEEPRARSARMSATLLGLALTFSAGAADDGRAVGSTRPVNPTTASQERPHMWMTVGTQRFAVRLEDNPTARAFVQLLPATLDMTELNGNEKHAPLPRSLPTNAARPGTMRTGDVLLYGSDTLVVFYETFRSSYSYTRIGRIEESARLGQALGPGSQRVTFTIP